MIVSHASESFCKQEVKNSKKKANVICMYKRSYRTSRKRKIEDLEYTANH